MTPAQIATIATLVLELGLTLMRRARRDASPEERGRIDREFTEVVEAARREVEAHPGGEGG